MLDLEGRQDYPGPNPWTRGPLPARSFGWGAVIVANAENPSKIPVGFQFAEFYGDHVKLEDGKHNVNGRDKRKRLEPHEILFYNNSLRPITAEEFAAPR